MCKIGTYHKDQEKMQETQQQHHEVASTQAAMTDASPSTPKKHRTTQILTGLLIVLLVIGVILFIPGNDFLPDEEHPPGPENPLGIIEPDKPYNEYVAESLVLDFKTCEPRTYTLNGADTNTTTTYEVHGIRPVQSSTGTTEYCALNVESVIETIVNPYTCLVPLTEGELTLENQFFGLDPDLLGKYCREAGQFQQELDQQ